MIDSPPTAAKLIPASNLLLAKSTFLPKIETKGNFLILTYFQTSSIAIIPFLFNLLKTSLHILTNELGGSMVNNSLNLCTEIESSSFFICFIKVDCSFFVKNIKKRF